MAKNRLSSDEFGDGVRKGPWLLEEDQLLIQYVSSHGEGRWNSLAKFAGLKRTGKSCRLRWLNYLKPDIKRGNLSSHEQLLILELHSKLGNRWSKIAKHLPGRTDNEIKNYWRTRAQKQARQLKVDSNSKKFLEAARMLWKPRLLEETEQNPSTSISSGPAISSISTMEPSTSNNSDNDLVNKMTSSIHHEQQDSSGNSRIQCEKSAEDIESYCFMGNHPFYDMQELKEHRDGPYGCQMEEGYWWGEESWNSNGFWNSDELWMFKGAEEIIGV